MLSHALNSEQFEELVDPRLEKNYVDREMFRMIEVAAACVRHSSAKRPQMGQVNAFVVKVSARFPYYALDYAFGREVIFIVLIFFTGCESF